MENSLIYILVSFSLQIVCFGIGFIALKLARITINGFYANAFAKILLGCILLVTTYACVITTGKTIMILFVPLLFFVYLYFTKNKLHNPNKQFSYTENKKETIFGISSIFIIIIIISAYILPSAMPNSEALYPDYFFDSVFYSKISEYLTLTGQENTLKEGNLISTDFSGVGPYHYFELWLNSLLSNAFGLSHLICYETSTKVFLITLVIIGCVACVENLQKIRIIHLIVCLSFVFIAGVYPDFYDKIYFLKQYSAIQSFPITYTFSLHKIIIITIFFITSILFLQNKKLDAVVFPLLAIAIGNFLSTAGLFSALIILFIINEFYNLGFDKKIARKNIGFIFLFFLIMMGFFYLFVPKLNIIAFKFMPIIKANLMIIPTKINYIIGLIISHIAYYIFFFVATLVSIKAIYQITMQHKNTKTLFFLLFLILACSSIISAFLAGIPDYVQIYSNNLTAILYLIPLLIFLVLLGTKNKMLLNIYVVYVLFIAVYQGYTKFSPAKNEQVTTYDNDFLKQVQDLLPTITNPMGVSIFTKDHTNNGNPVHNTLGAYLKVMKPYFNTVNAGTYLLTQETNDIQIQQRLSNTTFVYYVKKQPAGESFETILLKFIKEYNIQYLLFTKDIVLPEKIRILITKEIINKKTGEKFCLIKMQ